MNVSLHHGEQSIMLRSLCTIFCRRLTARADFRHSNPFECLDCKIFAGRKKLAHAKKHVV